MSACLSKCLFPFQAFSSYLSFIIISYWWTNVFPSLFLCTLPISTKLCLQTCQSHFPTSYLVSLYKYRADEYHLPMQPVKLFLHLLSALLFPPLFFFISCSYYQQWHFTFFFLHFLIILQYIVHVHISDSPVMAEKKTLAIAIAFQAYLRRSYYGMIKLTKCVPYNIDVSFYSLYIWILFNFSYLYKIWRSQNYWEVSPWVLMRLLPA